MPIKSAGLQYINTNFKNSIYPTTDSHWLSAWVYLSFNFLKLPCASTFRISSTSKNQPVGHFLLLIYLTLGHVAFSPVGAGGAASKCTFFSLSIIFSIHFAEHKLVSGNKSKRCLGISLPQLVQILIEIS